MEIEGFFDMMTPYLILKMRHGGHFVFKTSILTHAFISRRIN